MALRNLFIIIMLMGLTLWGLLGKAQDDNETIEEMVDRKIAAHEGDAEAHLSITGSLQSHKASEIIDHLADSIINDKIAKRAITSDQLADMAMNVRNISFETLAAFEDIESAGLNSGGLRHYVTPTNGSYAYAIVESNYGFPFDHSFLIQWRFRVLSLVNSGYSLAYSGDNGDPGSQGAGFEIVNGNLQAYYSYGPEEDSVTVLQDIPNISVTDWHVMRIEYEYNVAIKYYVDDILVWTVTSNLPDPTWGVGRISMTRAWTTENVAKYMDVMQIYYAGYN